MKKAKPMEVSFPIDSEQAVRAAFVKFHKELGFPKIVKTRKKFPDYILQDADGNRIRAEAEIFSSGAKKHDNLKEECDLIICWYDEWPECPLRVLELNEYIEAPQGPEMSFKTIVKTDLYSPHSKHLRMTIRDGVPLITFLWYKNKTNRTRRPAFLDEHEFKNLFEQIPQSIRKKVFVNLELKALWDWYMKK